MTQTTLIEEPEKAAEPQAISLTSRHHVSLAVVALEDRAGAIESLAKKAKDEGYHRISRELQADADMIREDLLPGFREQREIPLAGPEEAQAAIASYITATVHAGIAQKETPELLVERIAKRIAPAFNKVYEQGFSVGISNRFDEPEYAVVRACAKAATAEAKTT